MKKIKIPIIALAFFLLTPLYYVNAEESNNDFKINNEFKCSELKLKKNTVIIDYKIEDVNGDNIKDNIILIGSNQFAPNSPYRDDIRIIIEDGKIGKFYSVSPGKISYGYNSRLFLGDFDGDRLNDILVSIGTGGSGDCSHYSLFSFKKNKCKYLIKEEEFSKGLSYNVDYMNNFEVSIFNKYSKKLYKINVENKKYTYTNLGIYNDNGELLKDTKGAYDGVVDLVPVDIDKDGIYELKTIQVIWGISHVDILGYGKAIWKYNSKKMFLYNFELLEFAKPGSREKLQKVIPVWTQ